MTNSFLLATVTHPQPEVDRPGSQQEEKVKQRECRRQAVFADKWLSSDTNETKCHFAA